MIAKVSREEVAAKFLAPAPEKMLRELVQLNKITVQEAELAHLVPIAQDITAEADSGGHTDNRPALALLPTFLALRGQAMDRYGYAAALRIGLGGGIATPEAAAAAFAMGAAFVLTGSINQACREADTSEAVRQMLVQARQADVIMAPAADMFELGAKVQVLKRGTMFAMRASKLYDLYRAHDDYYQIPSQDRATIERDFLKTSFEQAQPGPDQPGGKRSQIQDGAGLPVLSRSSIALGQTRCGRAADRLSNLVRPGHGGFQRLGKGKLFGNGRPASYRCHRPEPALWRCLFDTLPPTAVPGRTVAAGSRGGPASAPGAHRTAAVIPELMR